MNRRTRMLGIVAAIALCSPALALDTTFTYQGRLVDGGTPADGDYDFWFALYDAEVGGVQVGPAVYGDDTGVADGFFTSPLDFGAGIFDGANLWLEVLVRDGASTGAYTTLAPRHPLTAAPYSLYALNTPAGWTASGPDIYTTNAGNVGIGTTSPVATLDVANNGGEWAIVAGSPYGGVFGFYGAVTGTNPGIQGETNSTSAEASGVRGVVTSTAAGSGSAGVQGINQGTGAAGSGVWGHQEGSGVGVYGTCPDGIGVFGKATGGTGVNYAVYGRTFSEDGYAGYFRGGKNYFEGSIGVNTTTPEADLDIAGKVQIWGDPSGGSGTIFTNGSDGDPIVVISSPGFTSDTGYVAVYNDVPAVAAKMYANLTGDGLIVADVKNFVSPNPIDPREDIWYACVEGPEAAMYVRGTGRLVDGQATIELPDHFRMLAIEDSMTVQLTPRSFDSEGLAVGHQGFDGIEVGELHGGRGNYDFNWEVKAVRRAHQDYQVTRPWTHAMPASDKDLNELWATRLQSIERRERRIQEMEERLADERDRARE